MIDTAIKGELGVADVAVLEHYGDPRRLLACGRTRLVALIRKASRGHHDEERADAWREVARAALELYGEDPAVPFEDLAAEMATEARLIRSVLAEREMHARRREEVYRVVDPDALARSLPGVAEIGGPVIVAAMGDPARFADAAAFKRFTGLTPRASEIGNTDRKGGARLAGSRATCVGGERFVASDYILTTCRSKSDGLDGRGSGRAKRNGSGRTVNVGPPS